MYSLGNPTNGSEFLYISILSMIMFFFISPRKPLERVRLIIYQCFPYHLGNSSNKVRVIMYPTIIYISSFLPWTTIILQVYSHISHSSHITLTNLPGICAETRGGGGELNVSHCLLLFHHIMFGNRGDVGTEFLPHIYSRRRSSHISISARSL